MNFKAIALTVLITAASAPAYAGWTEYVYDDIQIAKEFPIPPTKTTGVYKTPLAVSAPSVVYTAVQEGITYKMTVVDFSTRVESGANLLNEAGFQMIQGKGLTYTIEDFSLYDKGTNSVYGTILTTEKPNGARNKAGIFFNKGRLYIIEASAAPDAPDRFDPGIGRFVGTVRFHMAGYGFDYTNGHDYPIGDSRPENRDLKVIPGYQLPPGYKPPPGAPPLNTTPQPVSN